LATYSNPASLADIISSLGVFVSTIYYQNTTDVVFSTTLNDKYFRINYSTGKVRMYFKETMTPTQITNESRTISSGTFTLVNKPIVPNSDDFYSGSGKTGTHWVRDVNYTINNTTGVVTNINMSDTVYCDYQYLASLTTDFKVFTDYTSYTLYKTHMIVAADWFAIICEYATSVANEAKTISGGTFTLTNKPIKRETDDFWSGSGKTGTHWVRGVNYTINNTTGVVTNINMSGTVYANYIYPTAASNFGYVGNCDSGRDIILGGNGYSSIGTVHRCRDLTNNVEIEPVLFGGIAYDSNYVLTETLILKNKSSSQILKNGSDLDGVIGIKSCSHATTEVYTDGSSYLFFQAPWYLSSDGLAKTTNLLFQW